MTIDEVIIHAREVASRKFDDRVHCIRCAEEHERLAEWLEELKQYKEIGTVEECRNSVLDIQKAYNKAIDDFVNACKEDILCQTFGLHINGIERIAEQLKTGDEV